MKKFDYRKLFKIIKTVLNILVIILVILFFIVVCLQRFSNNRLSFFDYRMFTVVSGSMKPEYEIGDVLISKVVDPEDVKVGDTISYLGNQGDFANKVITHQVVEIEQDVDGNYYFHTKGLANLIEDPIVSEEQLYGVVIYRSVILSFIYKIISNTVGLFIFIVIPLLYLIGSEILSVMLEKEDRRRNKIKE